MTDQPGGRPTGGLTPFISIRDRRGREACAFYARAFGAELKEQQPAEDGERLMYAGLVINGDHLMLSDEFPEWGYKAGAPASVTLHLQVDDADAWVERAQAAGCEVTMPVADQFWGDRYGQLRDPFGHSWSIGGPLKGTANV